MWVRAALLVLLAPCAWGQVTLPWNPGVPTGQVIGSYPQWVNFNSSGHIGLVSPETNSPAGPTFNFKRGTTGLGDSADFQVTRNANYVGGDGSLVNSAFSATTTTASGANNFEWTGIFTLNNNNTTTDASQNVALAAKGYQKSTGITFGANISCISELSTAESGCIGLEIDAYGNGADVSGTRLPLHIIYGAGLLGGTAHVRDGIRIEQQNGGTAIIDRSAIYIDGDYKTGLTFAGTSSDGTGALVTDSSNGHPYGLNLGGAYTSAAIFLRDNKNILWSSDQNTKTRYVLGDLCKEDIRTSTVNQYTCDGGQVGVGNVNPATNNTAAVYYVGTSANTNAMASPYTLYRWGVPVALPSSGSFANNGALTLTTALPSNAACTSTVGCYMFFPANAIVAGNGGGVYYTQCSSTTACTVFNNLLSTGPPVKITSPTAFSTTGPGAYTQTTGSNITLITLALPANSLGANGSFTIDTQAGRISNANSVTETLLFNATGLGSINTASTQWYGVHRTVHNLGATNAQVAVPGTNASDQAAVNQAPSFPAVDTTISRNIVVQGQLNTAATDWLIIFDGGVTVEYAP